MGCCASKPDPEKAAKAPKDEVVESGKSDDAPSTSGASPDAPSDGSRRENVFAASAPLSSERFASPSDVAVDSARTSGDGDDDAESAYAQKVATDVEAAADAAIRESVVKVEAAAEARMEARAIANDSTASAEARARAASAAADAEKMEARAHAEMAAARKMKAALALAFAKANKNTARWVSASRNVAARRSEDGEATARLEAARRAKEEEEAHSRAEALEVEHIAADHVKNATQWLSATKRVVEDAAARRSNRARQFEEIVAAEREAASVAEALAHEEAVAAARAEVEAHHGHPLWQVFRDIALASKGHASEYELYFAFALTRFPAAAQARPLCFAVNHDWRAADASFAD